MSEVTNADIFNQLINMSGNIARVEAKIDNHAMNLAAHVADDKISDAAYVAAIEGLKLSHARQRGFIAAISVVGTAVSAGVGYMVDLMARGH